MSTATLSVSISEHDKKFLEKLASLTGQSEAGIAAEAIKKYVDVNERQIEVIRERLAAADQREYASDEQVKATFAKWGVNAE